MNKNFAFLAVALCFCTLAFAQSPEQINFQAVLRGDDGAVLENQPLTIIFSFHQASGASAVYQETHNASTDGFGLVQLRLGTGTPVVGSFQSVNWSGGSVFLSGQATLSTGGVIDIGEQQLVAVPFALHANTATALSGENDIDNTNEIQELTLSGSTLTLSGSGSQVNLAPYLGENTDEQTLNFQNNILSITNGNSVNLNSLRDVADNDPQNELQTLALDNNILSISNGNTVDLTPLLNDADADPLNEIQDLTLTGSTLSISGSSSVVNLAPFVGINTDEQTVSFENNMLTISNGNTADLSSLKDDADADPSNEIQDIVLDGSTLSISGSTSVVNLAPFLGTNTDEQVLSFENNIVSISNGNEIDLTSLKDDADADSLNEIQTLTFHNNILAISNGNSVNLTPLLNDGDSDPVNELQELILNGSTLSITGSANTIDLAPYLGTNTDEQTLSLTDSILAIANGNSIDLSTIDNQNLQEVYANGSEITLNGSDELIINTLDGQPIITTGNGNVGVGISMPLYKLHVEGKTTLIEGETLEPLQSQLADSTFETGVLYEFSETSVGLHYNVGITNVLNANSGNNYGMLSLTKGTSNNNRGIYSASTGGSANNTGLIGNAFGAANNNQGVRGVASGATTNWGIWGTSLGVATTNIGLQGSSSGATYNYGTYGVVTGPGTSNVGSYATATGSANANYGGSFRGEGSANINYGVWGRAQGGTYNYGSYFIAQGTAEDNFGVWGSSNGGTQNSGGNFTSHSAGSNVNNGVLGHASGATTENKGGYFSANGDAVNNYGVRASAFGSATKYGIFSTAWGAGTNYGIYASAFGGTTNYAGHFEGSVNVVGDIIVNGDTIDTTPTLQDAYAHGNQITLNGTNEFLINNAGGQSLLATSSGNVGIGTTTPTATLDVSSSDPDAAANFEISNSDNSHQMYFFPGRTSDPNPFIGVKDGDPLRIGYYEGSVFTERMRLSGAGNLGLGTSSPQHKLHVQSTTSDVQMADLNILGIGTIEAGALYETNETNSAANNNAGLISIVRGTGQTNYAFLGLSNNPAERNRGLYGYASGGTIDNNGLYGNAAGAAPLNIGVRGISSGATVNYGLHGSTTAAADFNVGLRGNATGATENIGGEGFATGTGNINWGIKGTASGGSVANYGGTFVSENAGPINYGVHASATGATTNYGLYASASGGTSYAGYFNGNVNVIGSLTMSGASGVIAMENFTMRARSANNFSIGQYNFDALTTGTDNIAFGFGVMAGVTEGSRNVAIGYRTMDVSNAGDNNLALGAFTYFNGTGNSNVALGTQSMREATSGDNNIAVGGSSLFSLASGNDNVSLGRSSMLSASSGSYNVAVGFESLFNNAGGNNNVAIGQRAGYNVASSSNNVLIGNEADVTGVIENSVAIGYGAKVATSNAIVLGDASNPELKVGIGTDNPITEFHVVGSSLMQGDLDVFGPITAISFNGEVLGSSDSRLKTDIKPIENATEILAQIEGKSYYWKKDDPTSAVRQYGVIAQELEKILPDLVKTDKDGMKAVNYISLIPFMIEALKSQQLEITKLKNENQQLSSSIEKRLEELTALIMEVKSSDVKATVTETIGKE